MSSTTTVIVVVLVVLAPTGPRTRAAPMTLFLSGRDPAEPGPTRAQVGRHEEAASLAAGEAR